MKHVDKRKIPCCCSKGGLNFGCRRHRIEPDLSLSDRAEELYREVALSASDIGHSEKNTGDFNRPAYSNNYLRGPAGSNATLPRMKSLLSTK